MLRPASVARLLGVLSILLATLAAMSSPAQPARPMLVGFQDDPGFRWSPDRATMLADAARAHATIIRATANWWQIAPRHPANAADPFDPAYNFTDLDDLVRSAAMDGMTVMLTIWGTPAWADQSRGPNYAPDHLRDLYDFSRAIAERYSGRHPGFPFVGYYTIWNEPNSARFLAPAFDDSGNPVSPRIYAGMCRFAYAGLKDGNPLATVAIGQTASRGWAHGRPGASSIAPGTFAELLAEQVPAVPFDAWAHHPYSDLGFGPLQRYRFPNVNLAGLHEFEQKLDLWFHRTDIPIWISEYGFQTRPGRAGGVTEAQQAAYVRESLAIAAADPRVQMFIWFVLRDDPAMSTWDSGLIGDTGAQKPSFAAFAGSAAPLDARDPVVHVPAGTSFPVLRLPVWELAIRDGPGARIGSMITVRSGGRRVGRSTPQVRIAVDGTASFPLPIRSVRPGAVYRVSIGDINDIHGNRIARTAVVVGVPQPARAD
ncbi:MAG TPA: cellulase family glycosylhydrolase [Gaiellaceae bacterium]|nr:cellulase family glycosylhydrolase [Gaiellaceae bacterium]